MTTRIVLRAAAGPAIAAAITVVACRSETPRPTQSGMRSAITADAPGGDELRCTPPSSMTLTTTLVPQRTEFWCWAASGETIMNQFNTRIRQCEQANKRFGMTTCCQSPTPRACIRTGWPEFDRYGFVQTQRTSSTALTWEQLTEEIGCQKRPVAFSWKWVGDGGHMMVAYGYQQDANGARFVKVHDPLPVGSGSTFDLSYEAYVSFDGRYTHWHDFHTIAR